MAALPSLDPKRVLILRVVAQHGSISAAARALGWTPPAVSLHLANLEGVVGQPVVRRYPSGAKLTEAGEVLVRHADAIAERLDLALEEIKAIERRDQGRIRLSCFSSSLLGLVPAALKDLRSDRRPEIDVMLIEAAPPDSISMLRAGEVDLALVYDWLDPDPTVPAATDHTGMVEVEIGGDAAVLILSDQNPKASVAELSLADLADCRFAAGCRLCREHLERCCARAGFKANITHQTHNHQIIRSLVSSDPSGLTVGMMATSALEGFKDAGLVVRSVAGLSGRRFRALHRPGDDQIPAVRRLLKSLVRAGAAASARSQRAFGDA
ncbi:MAG: LysR family transcriptional regulator [Propionibacteriaceae bacterium]|nr:LysR family transcriptional regulator [Propionibacteriaceae bacterium]